jgi:hypothetical protein
VSQLSPVKQLPFPEGLLQSPVETPVPPTSFYQPVVIPGVRGKLRRTNAIVRPPRPRKRCVMVHLSVLCLCLFVLVSVLIISWR